MFIHKHATDGSRPLPPKLWRTDMYMFPECTPSQEICMYLRRGWKVSNRSFGCLFFHTPKHHPPSASNCKGWQKLKHRWHILVCSPLVKDSGGRETIEDVHSWSWKEYPYTTREEQNANATVVDYSKYGKTPYRSDHGTKEDYFSLRLWLTVTSTMSPPAQFSRVR